MATKNAVAARSAAGRVVLPGRIAASSSVIGMSRIPAVIVIGWPIRIAESRPMKNSRPAKRAFMKARAASESGVRPSMKMAMMRGMSSMTAAICTANSRTFPRITPKVAPSGLMA
jgi:hypothetical protein